MTLLRFDDHDHYGHAFPLLSATAKLLTAELKCICIASGVLLYLFLLRWCCTIADRLNFWAISLLFFDDDSLEEGLGGWCLMEQKKWFENGDSKQSDSRDETPL